MANAHTAAYYLAQENALCYQQALPFLREAKKYLPQANERERLYVLATEAWSLGKIDQAIACCEELVLRFPQDILAVQRGQYHYFYQGNRAGLTSIAETALDTNPDNHYLLGMLAFGLEQCDHLSEAKHIGHWAVDLNRRDPWAHHAVAHVMESQGRYEEGIIWMENLADAWEDCNSILYTHNWWHIALFYLSKGYQSKVLSLYDRNFEQSHLHDIDLQGISLHGIDLSESILTHVNLSGSDLRGADLGWTDLSRANLEKADLRGAILTRADLSRANLRGANLLKADLSLTKLDRTNLSGAIMPDGVIHP